MASDRRCHNWTMRHLLVILLAKGICSLFCKQKRIENFGLNYNKKEQMTACIAHCLELITPVTKVPLTQCKYSDKNGKALGDKCSENFQPVSNAKLIFCDLRMTDELSSSLYYWKACDYIVHLHGVQYTQGVGLKWKKDMDIILPRVEEAKRYGLKNILQIGSGANDNMAPEDLSRVAESPTERVTFAKDIWRLLKEHKFDGVYIYWRFPGCPSWVCNRKQDKTNMVLMFREIYQLLEPEGKKLLFFTTAMHISPSFYLGNTYFNDVAPFVDYIVFEVTPQNNPGADKLDYINNNLKSKGVMKSATAKMTSSTLKKVIMTATFKSMQATLVDVKKSQIGSKIIVSENRLVGMVEICRAVKNSSWKIEKNANAQHLVSYSSYVIPYDDMDSMKIKMDTTVFSENYAGILVEETAGDDQKGECGCGRMPWLRTVGELLKGGNCIMKICF